MILLRRVGIGFLWQNFLFRNYYPKSLVHYSAPSSLYRYTDNTMDNFLRGSGSILQPGFETLRVYTGNEASDADSIVSALVSAYGGYCEDINNNQHVVRHQPIVSIDRSDLRLKQDVELLLKKASLLPTDFLCANEIPWAELHNFYENIEVVLLDHNCLHNKLENSLRESQLPYQVVEVIDHHLDANMHTETVRRRLVAFDSAAGKATAGSTCSLLVQRFQNAINWALNGQSPALLLLGVILLDTFAENPQFSKNTPIDDNAKEFLTNVLQLPTDQHQELFTELANAKFSPIFWQSLTASDCLRYDYKRFVATDPDNEHAYLAIGTSSVLLPVSSLISSKPDFLSSVRTYLEHPNETQERVDLVAILTFVLDPITQKPQRELLLISSKPALLDHFRTFARENARSNFVPEMNLDLQEVSLEADEVLSQKDFSPLTAAVFRQGNVAASRKQVAPVLLQIANNYLATMNK